MRSMQVEVKVCGVMLDFYYVHNVHNVLTKNLDCIKLSFLSLVDIISYKPFSQIWEIKCVDI